jgi:hypothetical protein
VTPSREIVLSALRVLPPALSRTLPPTTTRLSCRVIWPSSRSSADHFSPHTWPRRTPVVSSSRNSGANRSLRTEARNVCISSALHTCRWLRGRRGAYSQRSSFRPLIGPGRYLEAVSSRRLSQSPGVRSRPVCRATPVTPGATQQRLVFVSISRTWEAGRSFSLPALLCLVIELFSLAIKLFPLAIKCLPHIATVLC